MADEEQGNPAAAAADEQLPAVLVVDDDEGILKAVERTLRRLPVEVLVADSPTAAIQLLGEREVAVVISDYMMPGMNGLELLALTRQRWPRIQGMMMTACDDIRVAADAVNRQLVTSFITKPWETKAFRQAVVDAVERYRESAPQSPRNALDSQSLAAEMRQQAAAAAFSLARAVDARDRNTHLHSEQVAAFAQVIGRAMGCGEEAIEALRLGGLLHDLGKIGIPDGVLLKPGRLTDEEFAAVKRHPVIGESIVEPIGLSADIRAIIRQHHENHDGSGYPDGLSGDTISPLARIVHVVDAYEAMSSARVYRDAQEQDWIREELGRCSGSQFDPRVVEIFLEQLRAGAIASAARRVEAP